MHINNNHNNHDIITIGLLLLLLLILIIITIIVAHCDREVCRPLMIVITWCYIILFYYMVSFYIIVCYGLLLCYRPIDGDVIGRRRPITSKVFFCYIRKDFLMLQSISLYFEMLFFGSFALYFLLSFISKDDFVVILYLYFLILCPDAQISFAPQLCASRVASARRHLSK